MRALAVFLLLPAACHSQPQAAVNAQPPAKAVEAPPPRNDLQVAEDSVRRQLGNGQQDVSFANGVAYRNGRIAVVCGEVTRGGRSERYIAVDGRGAWLESEMRSGQMQPAVSEFCRNQAGLPQGHPS